MSLFVALNYCSYYACGGLIIVCRKSNDGLNSPFPQKTLYILSSLARKFNVKFNIAFEVVFKVTFKALFKTK